MIETDYVWMKPLPRVPRAETTAKGWAFPYGYITPTHPGVICNAHLLEMHVFTGWHTTL